MPLILVGPLHEKSKCDKWKPVPLQREADENHEGNKRDKAGLEQDKKASKPRFLILQFALDSRDLLTVFCLRQRVASTRFSHHRVHFAAHKMYAHTQVRGVHSCLLFRHPNAAALAY